MSWSYLPLFITLSQIQHVVGIIQGQIEDIVWLLSPFMAWEQSFGPKCAPLWFTLQCYCTSTIHSWHSCWWAFDNPALWINVADGWSRMYSFSDCPNHIIDLPVLLIANSYLSYTQTLTYTYITHQIRSKGQPKNSKKWSIICIKFSIEKK